MSAMTKRLEARISGRVQMVMFRDFVKRKARRLGLAGWVKNETSGEVLVVAEGEEQKLEELLGVLRVGPMLARVDAVDVRWSDSRGEQGVFTIRY